MAEGLSSLRGQGNFGGIDPRLGCGGGKGPAWGTAGPGLFPDAGSCSMPCVRGLDAGVLQELSHKEGMGVPRCRGGGALHAGTAACAVQPQAQAQARMGFQGWAVALLGRGCLCLGHAASPCILAAATTSPADMLDTLTRYTGQWVCRETGGISAVLTTGLPAQHPPLFPQATAQLPRPIPPPQEQGCSPPGQELTRRHRCAHTCTCIHRSAYAPKCMQQRHSHVQTYLCVHTQMDMHTHAQTHVHTHTHTRCLTSIPSMCSPETCLPPDPWGPRRLVQGSPQPGGTAPPTHSARWPPSCTEVAPPCSPSTASAPPRTSPCPAPPAAGAPDEPGGLGLAHNLLLLPRCPQHRSLGRGILPPTHTTGA